MSKTITTTLENANDVLDYASKSKFPSTGDGGKIYIDKSTNTIYRWDGSSYVVVGSGNTGTVTSVSVKMNDAIKGTITTSGTINLGTVITSHQDISGKQDKLVSGTNIKTINGTSLLGSGDLTISGGSGNISNVATMGGSTGNGSSASYAYSTLTNHSSTSYKLKIFCRRITDAFNSTNSKSITFTGVSFTRVPYVAIGVYGTNSYVTNNVNVFDVKTSGCNYRATSTSGAAGSAFYIIAIQPY